MKNDLISRSFLTKELKNVFTELNIPENQLVIAKVTNIVYSQPCAFDLCGVLHKLKSRKEKIKFDFTRKGMLKNACYDDAFEIVKSGCNSNIKKEEKCEDKRN